jgi:hypothetical protein
VSTKLLVVVGLIVAAWVAPGLAAPATRGGHVTADEPQYLMTAISLGEDHNLDLRDERLEGRYRVFHRVTAPLQEQVQDDGTLVSPHDPLLPAMLAVPMLLGGWIGAKLFLAALAGVLAATMLWIAVVRFGVSTRAATITVLAFSCAAPLAMYGTQVYPELPAALAVALTIAALSGPLGASSRTLAGAGIVALPWLSVKYAPVAAVLAAAAVFLLVRAGFARRAIVFVGALGVAGLVFGAAHLAWYGGLTPYASGSHFVDGEFTVVGNPNYVGRAIRLVGLMLDRDFGLAAWQPAYLLALPALVVLCMWRPKHWLLLVAPLTVGWLNATFVALTMHGWWWPGRQVVVVLPCVVVAVAWWAAARPVALRAVAVLGVLGASIYAWLIAQAVFGDMTLIVTFESAVSHPFLWAWRPLLPDYRDLHAIDWALHAAWLVAAVAVVLAIVRPRLDLKSTRLKGATTS